MKTVFLLMVAFFLAVTYTHAQHQLKIDSLNQELQKHEVRKKVLGATAPKKLDTIKVDLLYSLAVQYSFSKPDTLETFAGECLDISTKLQYKKGIGNAYNIFNRFYTQKGELTKAFEYAQKARSVFSELGDKQGMVYSLNRIGDGYNHLGKPDEALTYYLRAKTLAESIGDSIGIATCFNNLASITRLQGKTSVTLQYYLQSISILERNKTKDFATVKLFQAYQGVGVIYMGMKERLRDGIFAMEKAIQFAEEIGYRSAITTSLGNIGVTYRELGDNVSALKYFQSVQAEIIKSNDNDNIAWITELIGESYLRLGKLQVALKHTHMALPYALKSGHARTQEVYDQLSIIYGKLGKYQRAFEYQKRAIALKDSVNAGRNVDAIVQAQMKYEYSKHQDSLRAEQSKKDIIVENELQNQKILRNSFIGGFLTVLLYAGVFFRQRNRIKSANSKNEELLLNILPAEVAEELKAKGMADAKQFDNVTVLFTDFKSFTTVSEQLSPQELVNELHACFTAFDEICGKYNIEKIKTIGDAYLAVCGLPLADEKHAEKVVTAALEIQEFMANRSKEIGAKTFEIRIGINSGSVVAGIVGVKKFAYDIWGDTVNTAARMEQNSEAGKINISETTYALVKDQFTCEYRGEIDAKNKGKLKMYFVEKL